MWTFSKFAACFVLTGLWVQVGNAVAQDDPQDAGQNDAQHARRPVDAPRPVSAEDQGFLGVLTEDRPESPGRRGLKIHRVLSTSPADQAGLKPGDRLVRFHHSNIASADQLAREICKVAPGSVVGCEVLRQGKPVHFQVTLGSRGALPQKKSGEGRHVTLPERVPRLGTDSVTVWPQEPKADDPPTETPGVIETPAVAFAEKSLAFTITSPETMKVEIVYFKADQIQRQSWDGKPQELTAQMQDWPRCIKSDITDLLDTLPNQTRRKSRCHFRLAPRMNGNLPAVRIWLNYAVKDGHRRICVLDYTFKENQPLTGTELLKSSLLSSELKHLSPKYREAIEQTLQKMKVPRIESKVRQAQ